MIKLINISRKFNNYYVLKNINITFPDTGLFTLVGKSGCGKSTLLNIISLLDKDFEGKIIYNNHEYHKDEEDRRLLSRNIGIVYQNFNLLDELTVFENVKLSSLICGDDSQSRIEEILATVQISKKLWYIKCKFLSGGEKQRVAIARAIIRNPAIIIADEPTGSLDSKNGIKVMDILKSLSRNSLVILVTHNLRLAKRYSDEIIEFNHLNKNYEFTGNKKIKYNYQLKHDKSLLLLLKNHFFSYRLRYLIIILSLVISFVFSVTSLSFIFACNNIEDNLTNNFYDRNVFKIYKTITKKIDNSIFSLTQLMRPSINEIESFKKILPPFEAFYDLGAIIPESISLVDGNSIIKNVAFLPYFDTSKEFGDVVVNRQFYDLLNKNEFTYNFECYYIENAIIEFGYHFHINKVIDEVSLLNSPKIYYNYYGAKSLLQSKIIHINEKNKNLYQIIVEANSDDKLSNYHMILVLKNSEDVDLMFKIINKKIKDYEISNSAYSMSNAVGQLIKSINSFLIIFEAILLTSAIAILMFVIISLIYDQRNEKAIILSMGKKESSFFMTYLIEMLIVNVAVLFISVPIFLIITKILDKILFINNNISLKLDIFISLGICSLVFVVLGLLVMSIAYEITRKENMLNLLRDE